MARDSAVKVGCHAQYDGEQHAYEDDHRNRPQQQRRARPITFSFLISLTGTIPA
jgi:hypothetical protein